MQLFVRVLDSRCLAVEASCVGELKQLLQDKEGIPATYQRLLCGSRQLEDGRSLTDCQVQPDSTVHLVLRLRGGKGGFGALLRAKGGKASLTDNFDACRDLSGRRLRHANAEQKLADWAAEGKAREAEKAAKRAQREAEKAAAREQRSEVDMDDVRIQQRAALDSVQSAVASGLTAGGQPSKRKLASADAAAAKGKKPKFFDIGDDLSDSELESSDEEDGSMPGSEGPSSSDSGTSAQEALAASGAAGEAGAAGTTGPSAAPGAEPSPAALEPAPAAGAQSDAVATTTTSAAHPAPRDPAAAKSGSSQAAGASQSAAGTQAATAAPAQPAAPAVPAEPVDLGQFESAADLEALGLERLKQELQRQGLKCGGSLAERAQRLFLLKSTPIDKLDKKLLAKK